MVRMTEKEPVTEFTQQKLGETEIWGRKKAIINEFYKNKSEKQLYTVASFKGCNWCDPFRDHGLHHCLNCGKKLKK